MKPSVVYLRPKVLAFVRAFGPYHESVERAWGETFAWLDVRSLRDEITMGYGLAYDDPRHVTVEKCRYDACVELPVDIVNAADGVEGLRMQNLPGGSYVRSRVTGSYGLISKSLSSIRDDWVPKQGLTFDTKRPVIAVYFSDPRFVPEDQRKADVCVPIAPGAAR